MAQKQPMYRYIADALREQIKVGDLKAGGKLPTEDELGDTYEASRNTVRGAIKLLVEQNLIETRPGQGTFVKVKIDPFVTVLSTETPGIDGGGTEGATYLSVVTEQHREPSTTIPKIEVQPCPRHIALRLRIETGAQVISRHQRRYIDKVPWSLQTSFYPFEWSKKASRLLTAEDIEEGTVKYLAETLGLEQVGYRDWITVRMPDSSEVEFFGIADNQAMSEILRTGFTVDGTATRVTVTAYPADRNQLVVNSGKVPELYEEDPKPAQRSKPAEDHKPK
jgi:GntR family transcriptional regulator